MTPQQFLAQIRQQQFPPACLLLGPEPYQRDYCRNALIEQFLGDADRELSLAQYDLQETSLSVVLEDASSLSLFAPRRVIRIRNAEEALPRGRAAGEREEGGAGEAELARYLADPPEGVVLVFEASRISFESEDKARLSRLRQFYAGVPAVVECAPLKPEQARQFARNLARRAGLAIGEAELDLLVEVLGAEAARIAGEIEKLSVWAAQDKEITAADIAVLVPEARSATIFELVEALARKDRTGSLEVLDTLVRQGEYLALALSFLSTELRLALAARQGGWSRPDQIQAQAARLGVRMWPARAQQVARTAAAFSTRQLASALRLVHAADKALRDARPDDRIVLEEFIFQLAGNSPPSSGDTVKQ